MNQTSCATHPDRAATHRCEGCGQPLCGECIDDGHRLIFCRLCGEQALPLSGPAPRTQQQRRQARIQAAAADYSLADALAFPFRGLGVYAFWGFVGLLFILQLIRHIFPIGGGLLTFIPRILISLLLPGFLFAIARSSTRGEDELPDWPDLDLWHNLGELILFGFVSAFSLIPMALLFRATGCHPAAMLAGETSLGACLLGTLVGPFLAVALWIPTFGSVALFESGWLMFRVDLHVRVALADLGEFVAATVLVGGLFVISLLSVVFVLVPLVGGLLATAATVYGLFTGAHLVGVYFRRHYSEIESLYLEA